MCRARYLNFLIFLTIEHLILASEDDVILSLRDYFGSKLVLVLAEANDSFSQKVAYDLMKRQEKDFYIGNGNIENVILVLKKFSRFSKPLVVSFNLKLLTDLLQKIKSYELKNFIWAHFINSMDDLQELEKLYIPYDCQFIIIKKLQNNYEIFELYKLKKISNLIEINFDINENPLRHTNFNFYNRRINLNGLNFSIAATVFEFDYSKQHSIIWNLLQQKMNFNWKLANSEPLSGSILANGTATGVFKFIEENKADGSTGNFVVTADRLDRFSFIFPTYNIEVKILLASQPIFNWTSYIAPFSQQLWFAIISWAILASLCLFIINKSHRYFFKNKEKSGSFFIIIKILCYQGANLSSSRLSLLICWLMPYVVAIVIIQAYSGALQSYFTVQDNTPPFQSLEGLVRDGNYKVTTVPSHFMWFFFLSDNSEESKIIRNKLLKPIKEQPKNSGEGLNQLCESKILQAFITITPLAATVNCKIIELKVALFRRPAGMIFMNHFPFEDAMNLQLKHFQETGLIINSLKRSLLTHKSAEDLEEFFSLGIDNVFPIFFFYTSALFLAVIVFMFEILKKF